MRDFFSGPVAIEGPAVAAVRNWVEEVKTQGSRMGELAAEAALMQSRVNEARRQEQSLRAINAGLEQEVRSQAAQVGALAEEAALMQSRVNEAQRQEQVLRETFSGLEQALVEKARDLDQQEKRATTIEAQVSKATTDLAGILGEIERLMKARRIIIEGISE